VLKSPCPTINFPYLGTSMRFLYPPRPKGRMLPTDLPLYENSGDWIAQRKFRGSRVVVYISKDRKVHVGSRHGKPFANFDLTDSLKNELVSNLDLEANKDYWLDGELMNKDVNSTKEIILFDVLHIGKYLFYKPTQKERLEILSHLCRNPKKLCSSGIALEMSQNFWLAETFDKNFESRYKECLSNPQLEGLVLRKKNVGLENLGEKEYETSSLIRCRKPFSDTKGYEF
jgi:ATP-dependent DNA ligase